MQLTRTSLAGKAPHKSYVKRSRSLRGIILPAGHTHVSGPTDAASTAELIFLNRPSGVIGEKLKNLRARWLPSEMSKAPRNNRPAPFQADLLRDSSAQFRPGIPARYPKHPVCPDGEPIERCVQSRVVTRIGSAV